MRPHGSPALLEGRRLRAVDLLALGLRPAEVARRVHCHPSSVIRWRDTVERHGRSGLKAKPIPGRPWKLTKTQCARLVDILRKGAVARGYATEVWTTLRIAEVIKEEFGKCYHRDHIGRLMHRLKWSHRKPKRRAVQRDEKKIERWMKEEWPRIKKGLHGWRPTSCS